MLKYVQECSRQSMKYFFLVVCGFFLALLVTAVFDTEIKKRDIASLFKKNKLYFIYYYLAMSISVCLWHQLSDYNYNALSKDYVLGIQNHRYN